MTHLLFYPMAFYVFFMGLIGVWLFTARTRAVVKGELPIKYFKTFSGTPPERLVLIGRHYDNQFQLPLLFLITCLAFISLQKSDALTVTLAWLFIVSRLIHSWVHLGRNRVQWRAMAFAAGWLILLVMWGVLVFSLQVQLQA